MSYHTICMAWLPTVFLHVEHWAQGHCKMPLLGSLALEDVGQVSRTPMVGEGRGGLRGTIEHPNVIPHHLHGLAPNSLSACGALGPRPLQNATPGQPGLGRRGPGDQDSHGG